jgi:hypothetical protein
MDVMSDPAFWGEVGLAAAARLAVLAAVVWVARMVLIRSSRTPSRTASREAYVSATTPRNRAAEALAPAATYFDLQQAAEPSAGTAPRSATRDRLMQYLQQRSAERTKS